MAETWETGLGEQTQTERGVPSVALFPTVISKYQETETQFIGSQDHLDGRKLEQRLEQILERIKRYQSQKLTFCF